MWMYGAQLIAGLNFMDTKCWQISRHELYKKVWEIPMTKLSAQFKMSDVGLAKICKKYNIPRPLRGYWAKKAAGQKVKKIQLPNRNSKDNECSHQGIIRAWF